MESLLAFSEAKKENSFEKKRELCSAGGNRSHDISWKNPLITLMMRRNVSVLACVRPDLVVVGSSQSLTQNTRKACLSPDAFLAISVLLVAIESNSAWGLWLAHKNVLLGLGARSEREREEKQRKTHIRNCITSIKEMP